MKSMQLGLALAVATAFVTPAFAQVGGSEANTQRDLNQQQRIERGLQSGQLDTREAGRLERGEARIDRLESRAGRDGSVSATEQARITAAQNRESTAIRAQKHDAQTGDPASSQRLQRDVRRNVDQQARIEQGERSGQLTTRESAALERGQARTDRATARAAADGRIGAGEQRRLQAREDRQSARVYRKKHNGVAA